MITRVNHGSPPHHLVNFLAPRGFAESLLQDDARFAAFRAGGRGLGLHGAGREVFGGLYRSGLLSERANSIAHARAEYETRNGRVEFLFLRDMDAHLVDGIVEITAGVPRRRGGLSPSLAIGCAREDSVVAGCSNSKPSFNVAGPEKESSQNRAGSDF
jgi:hypothetical protein